MNWYYAKNGAQHGPVALEDMKSRVSMGEISPGDLAWREGMADWMPVSTIAELKVEPPPARSSDAGMPPQSPASYDAPAPAPEPYRPPTSAPAAHTPYPVGQAPSQGLAIASLVCGIVSLIGCCAWFIMIPVGLIAIVLGFIALAKAKDPARFGGKGMARTGIITGFLGLILSGIFAYFAVQLQGLPPEEVQEKIINWFPAEMREEMRREMEKNQAPKPPVAPTPAP
ncbi:GYF domain-containing protein [Luteolibacter sp. Populi]|uniref:GYF domain-containing protein n=1 Tax=Luteolibacter sp. Populi TaxID=3230487 RepID=UPI0034656554